MRQSAFIDRVYRLRQRFLAVPVASAVAQRARGPKPGGKRLSAHAEQVVGEVLQQWLPKQRELAHPLLDTPMEVRRRCLLGALVAPGRNAVARRMAEHRDAHAALLATELSAQVPPSHFTASAPLEMVQIDHTQADVEVVDEWFRRSVFGTRQVDRGCRWPSTLRQAAWWPFTSRWNAGTLARWRCF